MSPLPRPGFRWCRPVEVPEAAVRGLHDALGLPRGLCEVLVRRGVADPDAARRFLRPQLAALHPGESLPDVKAAVTRIERALDRREPILVHGDYDVDGMAATALLVRALSELGGRVEGFVPHRIRDGYDLGSAGLERARALSAGLIVTADCGTRALGAIGAAAEAGIDVVVTDHHRPGHELPAAVAVVNPTRRDSRYPFQGLAGVGVAFKLVSELFVKKNLTEEHLNQHLDVVALGTVGDLAPLEDENRILVRLGLRALQRTRKFGLQALLWTTGLLENEGLRASDVAFRLAPRLNAAGRIGSASDGLRLLLTDDRPEAIELAGKLDRQNAERQTADRALVEEASSRLEESFSAQRDRAVVLAGEGWHPGLLGIAASRIARRVHRPTVIVSFDGELGRASARSIAGFNLIRALEACAPLLERYGGHAMAAGLTIRRSKLPEFAAAVQELAMRQLAPEQLVPPLELDLETSLADLTPQFARLLEHLGPFGIGNPRPKLLVRRVRVGVPSRMGGQGEHLRLRLEQPDTRGLEAVGFGMGGRAPALASGETWDAVFELRPDTWQGQRRTRAYLLDLRPSEPLEPLDDRSTARPASAPAA